MEFFMRDAVATSGIREASGLARYPIARLFTSGAHLLLHPILILPVLVYLLGGSHGQIAWYAIVAGVANGLSAPSGALVAILPSSARLVIAVLLGVQILGFLLAGAVGLGAGAFDDRTLLRMAALAYLLLVITASMLARISEQGHEYRQAAAATLQGVLPAIAGTAVAAIVVWRLFFIGGMAPDDLLGRLLLGGALFAAAGSWLATYPTLLAQQLPHPARPMPTVRSPELRTNRPLRRYSIFHTVRGISRFADPFLFVGVLSILAPSIVWIGGAALAYGLGEGIARLMSVKAFGAFNVRTLFTISGTLHAITFIVVAFTADILNSSLIAEREPSEQWRNWAVIAAAITLGASHRFARTGHHAYVRSISSPGTRDISLTIIGVVMIITAFSPLIAVRILEGQDLATLLQVGAGASIIALLATAMVVPTYRAPRRPRDAWSLRR
jgi:hypothetical protein